MEGGSRKAKAERWTLIVRHSLRFQPLLSQIYYLISHISRLKSHISRLLSQRQNLNAQFLFRCPGANGFADFEPVPFLACPGGTFPLRPAVPATEHALVIRIADNAIKI